MLAINLCGTSLSEDRFLELVIDELQQQKLPKGAICFEITETATIPNRSGVIHFMQALKTLLTAARHGRSTLAVACCTRTTRGRSLPSASDAVHF